MRPPVFRISRLQAGLPGPGAVALAAFAICALSGLLLATVYRPDAPGESLARLLMKNPLGSWVRSVHFWSAQGFLVGAFLHLLGCLRRREETRMTYAAWLRLVLAGPVILFALLSGFMLRGDPAAEAAMGVFRNLVRFIPPGGGPLALVLAGSGPGLTVIFWHHALTATVVLAILLGMHFRRVVPAPRALGWVFLAVVTLSVLWVPGLSAYPQAREPAPWYLAGMQEFLQWMPEPGLAVGLALIALLVLAILPTLSARLRRLTKAGLAGALVAYAVVTVVALARRTPSPPTGGPAFVSARLYLPVGMTLRQAPVATVAGRPEGCLACHQGMTGFSPVHNPAVIGCTSCHLGNPFTLDARLAHAGMTLTPGNLSVVRETCATAGCHADIARRVQGALMNTMSGVAAVDKVVFGESRDLDHFYDVARLDHSPADRHLRNLCVSCHLGQDKRQPAAITQQSRGGGCSACHLDYGREALAELNGRGAAHLRNQAPQHHPDISVRVTADACFGCHSRSGRISHNYEGWHETLQDPAAAQHTPGWPQ